MGSVIKMGSSIFVFSALNKPSDHVQYRREAIYVTYTVTSVIQRIELGDDETIEQVVLESQILEENDGFLAYPILVAVEADYCRV